MRDERIKLKRINPFKDLPKVAKYWKEIEKKSDVSFFNSWKWVSSWLECLPSNSDIELITIFENDTIVACFFIGVTKRVENRFLKKRAYLNSVGLESYDDIVIEYNSILCKERKDINSILSFAMNSLKDIEEFRFPLTANIDLSGLTNFFHRKSESPSYWINLENIKSENDYLATISKNKKGQLKRSLKEYAKQGNINIEFASSLTQAKDFFLKLEELHQKEWEKRNQPGSFSNPFFKKFHHRLIEKCFNDNQTQLARVYTPEEDIGYLYYFLFHGEILFYQSGFNYKASNKYRPGLVSHFFAINAYAHQGHKRYNFLAGEAQYKKSLASNYDQLNSLVISRKTVKSYVEFILRKVRG